MFFFRGVKRTSVRLFRYLEQNYLSLRVCVCVLCLHFDEKPRASYLINNWQSFARSRMSFREKSPWRVIIALKYIWRITDWVDCSHVLIIQHMHTSMKSVFSSNFLFPSRSSLVYSSELGLLFPFEMSFITYSFLSFVLYVKFYVVLFLLSISLRLLNNVSLQCFR